MNKQALIIDIETNNLAGDEIWCVGLVSDDLFINNCIEWDEDTTPAYLSQLFEEYIPVFHNAKFDVRVLREHGVHIEPGSYWDTMVMSYVWNPRREQGHGLESWGKELGTLKAVDDGVHSDDGWVWNDTTKERIKRYCLQDCIVTLKLFEYLLGKLKTDPKAMALLQDIELPFIDCLIEMESTGFYIDVDASKSMVTELEQRQGELLSEMSSVVPFVPGKEVVYKKGYYKRNGEVFYSRCELDEFNPSSSRHIIWALTTLYGWEPEKFTPSGQPATDADTLEGLEYPLTVLLNEYSVLVKMHGMVTGYMERLDGRRLYGNFNQVVTKTGRLSSSDPNLQNIPTNGVWGKKMRSLFCSPGAGWKMVGCDLSNIEGRVLAHYLSLVCKETRMAETFAAGVDFHQANADAWGVTRKEAKTLLYAICYGAGAAKVGGGDKKRGQQLMDTVDANMPALKRLKEMVWETCRKRGGLIHSQFGRRLYYPEINESYAMRKAQGDKREAKQLVAQAERRVFNALLQGTAADVLKHIVLTVWRDSQLDYGAYLIANVHDEGLYYVPDEYADIFALRLEETFALPLLSHCPIMGEPKTGMNWNDIH